MRFAIIIGGVVILYILGARSELVSFLVLAIVLVVLFTLKDIRYFLYFIIGGLLFFLALAVIGIEIQSRQTELINLASSRSWQVRMYLQDIAIKLIIQSPILGVFGGHVLEGGSTSTYSHNVLSAWVNYGVVGFLLYILLTTIAIVVSVYYFLNRKYNDDWLLSFCINFVSLVLMTGAKSVFWTLPALGWGLYVRACLRTNPSHVEMIQKGYKISVSNSLNTYRTQLQEGKHR
jgi:O-antigen ligase